MQPKPAIFATSRACITRVTGSSNPAPSSGFARKRRRCTKMREVARKYRVPCPLSKPHLYAIWQRHSHLLPIMWAIVVGRGQFSRPSRRSYRTALRWSNRRRPPSGTQASWPGPLIIYAAWGVPSDLPFGETWAMALEPDGAGAKASDGCATRRALGEASGPP